MGVKYEWRTLDDVVSIAEGLSAAAANMSQIAMLMTQNQMEKGLFTWAQRHWDAYDIITTAAATCVSLMPAQVDAKRQNRPSKYEKTIRQSAKDAQTKLKKKAPSTPPKPRGRPKKGTV